MKNLELWNKVEKTNPKYTKKAKIGGNSITSIAPQYQIMNATEQFGVYGQTWGFKNIVFDYSITNTPITIDVQDYNTKQVDKIQTILGLVGFKATFFFPEGEFEITNSIKIFTDNKHSKIDDNYAKKLETDALTKALSKLGFNADIFMGKFDDVRYVNEMNVEFGNTPAPQAAPQPASQPVAKETLTDERFENALRLIAEGKYTVEKLKAVYNLTPNQLTKL
jgi:hypothetical protein